MRRLPIFLCLAFALTACGGGGGGSTTSALPTTGPIGGTQTTNGGSTAGLSLPSTFAVVDLGVDVAPAAINNRNSVAGTEYTISSGERAFIYRNGKLTSFPSPSGAVAINDSDVAAGDAFAYMPNGSEVALQTLNSALVSVAGGIDDSGRVVGVWLQGGVAGCSGALTTWSLSGVATAIGNTANTLAVSHNGKIVLDGYSQTGNGCTGTLSPYYYPGNTPVPIPAGLTLAVGPTVNSGAVTGVNDSGDVIGYGQKTGTNEVATFFARGGTATEIDPPAGSGLLQGQAINSSDWIVGVEFINAEHAFLWSNGTLVDLNTRLAASCSSWTLNSATGVNDNGYIVGIGTLNGKSHGFMLVPSP
ncbi:MAG: hypothetical protein JO322_02935 [Candidatus Eremiobacteraeota bacterium]|nr:hypothetical protein [Candidatus Eremiobacteraeota bacterium]